MSAFRYRREEVLDLAVELVRFTLASIAVLGIIAVWGALAMSLMFSGDRRLWDIAWCAFALVVGVANFDRSVRKNPARPLRGIAVTLLWSALIVASYKVHWA